MTYKARTLAVATVLSAASFTAGAYVSNMSSSDSHVSANADPKAPLHSSIRKDPEDTTEKHPVDVCAMLFVWYGYNGATKTWTGGLGTSHWDSGPSTVVVDKPAAGYYSSVAQIPTQLGQMWSAGINCVVVDWWGYGVTNFSHPGRIKPLYTAINDATKEVFADARRIDPQFKVVLFVDDFPTTAMNPSDYAKVYSYINKNFYKPYSSELMEWEGKPLLIWFNPLVPPSDSRVDSRVIGNNMGMISPGWYFWTTPPGDIDVTTYKDPQSHYGPRPPSPDGFISVIPRYDDFFLHVPGGRGQFMRADYTYVSNLYSTEWQYAQGQAQLGRVKMVFIYSWNEYHERSEIESHQDSTSGVSQNYLSFITKTNIAILEQTAQPFKNQ